MSRESSDDDERQYDPSNQICHELDAFSITRQPSFNLEVTPPSPPHGALAPTQTDPYAAQYSPGMLYPVQNQSGQVPPGQWYPAQNQPGQSLPSHWYYPVQSQLGQSVPGQNESVQNQPLQVQPMQTQPPLPNAFYYEYPTWSAGDVVGCLRAAHILFDDMRHIDEVLRPTLSKSDWEPVDQLVRSHKLTEWLHSRAMPNLLVHGDQRGGSHISGLSVFCESLRGVLAMYPGQFIPLLFFCGMHDGVEDDDTDDDDEDKNTNNDKNQAAQTFVKPSSDPCIGAAGLIRSFASQLLEHYYILYNIGIVMVPGELDAILNGDLDALYALFSRLLCLLPPNFTVFCLVDGVDCFEQDELLEDMKLVMEPLLQISRSRSTQGSVKVLLTAPSNTSDVCDWVDNEAILSLADIGQPGQLSVTDSVGLRSRLASVVAGRNQEPDS